MNGYQQLIAYYDLMLETLTVPYESVYVPTAGGDTHLLAAGDPQAPPLVLIHGASVNATMWLPNIPTLSQHFRLYVVDIPGEAGKSAQIKLSRRNFACVDWLCGVLDALQLTRTHIAGVSLGGWLALKLAIHAPQRLNRMVSICPGLFLPLSFKFLYYTGLAAMFPGKRTARAFIRALTSRVNPVDERLVDGMELVFKHVPYNPSFPKGFSDNELRSITTPTLFLIGADEVIYNVQMAVNRAQRLIPNVCAEVIPNAGHGVNGEQAELVNQRMIEFLLC